MEKYGDALVCVRFRYDAKLRQRLKTVELIVESTDLDATTAEVHLVDGEQLAEKLKEFQLGIKTEMIEKVTLDKDWFANL